MTGSVPAAWRVDASVGHSRWVADKFPCGVSSHMAWRHLGREDECAIASWVGR